MRSNTIWIAIALVACAAAGGWLGQRIGGNAGMVVLGAAVCGVLGSFIPGSVRWTGLQLRRRDRGRP